MNINSLKEEKKFLKKTKSEVLQKLYNKDMTKKERKELMASLKELIEKERDIKLFINRFNRSAKVTIDNEEFHVDDLIAITESFDEQIANLSLLMSMDCVGADEASDIVSQKKELFNQFIKIKEAVDVANSSSIENK